jgi:hypothetical protein
MVSPHAQLGFTNFDLQIFQLEVFHRSLLARVTHYGLFPVITLSVFAGLHRVSHAVSVGALGGLLALCGWIAGRVRLFGWCVATVLMYGALWFIGTVWARSPGAFGGLSPWFFALGGALVAAVGHWGEPELPPRVADDTRWVDRHRWLFGVAGARPSPRDALARWSRILLFAWVGTFGELWAAPRLLPYELLLGLMKLGYAPELRALLRDRRDRALAVGNPALDYVGIGGGTFLTDLPA